MNESGCRNLHMAQAAPDPDIVACGAVIVHEGAVLLVHRPRYDDWAFPKGKQDPGEHYTVTAVREVLEETGVEVRLGLPLSSQAYVQADGRTKIVHYWMGHVVGDPDVSSYVANSEIDKVCWVPLEMAPAQLTYAMDRTLIDEAQVARHHPTTPLIVLRHAKARSRKRWSGDDRGRPLTPMGERQALALRPVLAAYAVSRVITSSSTRCADTVLPYAHEHVTGIKATPRLSEENIDPRWLRKWLKRTMKDAEPTVVCSHRPVLPQLYEALRLDASTQRLDTMGLAPAELLVVHHVGRDIIATERHHVTL